MTADFQPFSFESQAGRPALVLLARAVSAGARLDAVAARCAAGGVDFLLLGTEDLVRGLSFSWAVDCGADFLVRFLAPLGVAGDALLLAVDRGQRVAFAAGLPGGELPEAAVRMGLEALARLPAALPAPVLVLPNLLSPESCRALVERINSGETIDGEVAGMGADGRPESRVDHRRKCRRDMLLAEADPLHGALRDGLLAACAPEMARAFQVCVAHTDRILLARYDAGAGWFARHRDTNAANIAFREFALSVCLDGEGFEGGALLFPEYNDHPHRLATGAGLIFSAALLHEVTPVTAGARHVLLTFLHGPAAEARRLELQASAA